MKYISINETQVVPLDKVDFYGIDSIDKTKLIVHTIGGYTVEVRYNDKETCKSEFESIDEIIRGKSNN